MHCSPEKLPGQNSGHFLRGKRNHLNTGNLISIKKQQQLYHSFHTVYVITSYRGSETVAVPNSPCGLCGKQKGLGLIPLRLTILFRKVVVCGHFVLHN